MLAIIILVGVKIVRILAVDSARVIYGLFARYFIRLTLWNALKAVFVGFSLVIFSPQLSDVLQGFEQTKLNPVYRFETADEKDAVLKFETAIQKNIGAAQFETVRKYCVMAADSLGCSLLDIYAVALSECGLNPYAIHRKGCAAGFTQLTNAGCAGLQLNGEPVTLEKVKQACKNRDIQYIMETAFIYWIDRAKGRKCVDLRDFYMLVFAPAFVGCKSDAVLYSGAENPKYYMNEVFDGYFIDSNDRICRLNKYKDYQITAGEVELHVTRKKIEFLKK